MQKEWEISEIACDGWICDQLDQPMEDPETWWIVISGCVCESVSGRFSQVHLLTESSSSLSPMWWASSNSPRAWREQQQQQKRRKGEFAAATSAWLLRWGMALSSCPETAHTICCCGSQAFGLTLNDTPGSPGSPVCKCGISVITWASPPIKSLCPVASVSL